MKTKEDLIEDIQEVIIRAGGRLFRQREILDMQVKELLHLFVCNGIKMDVNWEPPKS